MIIKTIIANTKFGLLILDSDNEDFEETFVGDTTYFVYINRESENLQKEAYGLYECELSWVEEDVYLESYKSSQITWDVNGLIIKKRVDELS